MNIEVPSFGFEYMHGSHQGPKPPAFCRSCGRPMQVTVEPHRYTPFDPVTGEPQTERHARCGRPWWAQFIGFHDHAIEDWHHDWPWL